MPNRAAAVANCIDERMDRGCGRDAIAERPNDGPVSNTAAAAAAAGGGRETKTPPPPPVAYAVAAGGAEA